MVQELKIEPVAAKDKPVSSGQETGILKIEKTPPQTGGQNEALQTGCLPRPVSEETRETKKAPQSRAFGRAYEKVWKVGTVWLGDLDSNQDSRSQSPMFYR